LVVNATPSAAVEHHGESESELGSGLSGHWWVYLLLVLLLLHSAFFSGNNIGVLAMDMRYLELMTKGPFESKKEEKEAEYVKALLPQKRRGHQILVVVLFMIAIMNASISILMADIEGNISGFFMSTALIVIIAEIIPQTLVNRYPILISYHSRYIMWFYFIVLSPFAYPVGIVLDRIFGEEEGSLMTKSNMKKLFENFEKQNILKASERKILISALP
jgi:metal transporter CNNM